MMKSSISKKDLENDPLFDTLQALHSCVTKLGLELYVVGATARDLIMKLLDESPSKRETSDLDVAIVLSDWSQFDNLSKELLSNHFHKGKSKQKFYYKGEHHENDYEVDIVPFGDIADDEVILWPPDGTPEMSVKCFTDVMNHSIPISVDEKFIVHIAPLAGQFFIKLDSWMDRHDREHKDADDMFFILGKFYMTGVMDGQTPTDDVNDSANSLISGAQWIASIMRSILSTDHLNYYSNKIKEELDKETESELIKDFILLYGDEKDEAYEMCYNIWHNIYEILNKEIAHRNEDQ
jgi:hypothetical protein